MFEGTMSVLTLNMDESLCSYLLCHRVDLPYYLNRISNDTAVILQKWVQLQKYLVAKTNI